MAKKKVTEVTKADIEAASPKKTDRREVVYTIMVPGLTTRAAVEGARTALQKHQVARHLIHVNGDVISVPRLFTLWQGDALEKAWQEAIKAAVPGAIIDVADWTPAPGYPIGNAGVASDGE